MKEFKEFWEEISTDKDKVINYIIRLYVNRKKSIDKYDEVSKICKTIDHRDYFKLRSKVIGKQVIVLDKLIASLGKKFFSTYNIKDKFWTEFETLDNKKYSDKLNKIYWSEHFFIKTLKIILKSKNTSPEVKEVLSKILLETVEERYYLGKISNYRLNYDTYLKVSKEKDNLKEVTYHYHGYE